MPDAPLSLTAPHAEKLSLRRVSLTERLGQPFACQLELYSTANDLSYEDFLGQPVTVSLELPPGGLRYINGIVVKFGQVTQEGNWHRYAAELRPWFWLLTRTADCRIFQNLSIPDIFKQVCSDLGFTDYKDTLSGTYNPREYCVQYRESTFDFLSRLLEHEGIYYYFTHESAKHQLVLSDGIGSHDVFPGYAQIPFAPEKLEEERISVWNTSVELRTGRQMLRDYDYLKPSATLDSKLNVQRQFPYSDLEVYDYPGGFQVTADGDNYARVRSEEQQAQYQLDSGESDARGLVVGSLFKLTDHVRDDQNQQYLVVSASQSIARTDTQFLGDEGGIEYRCSFTTIPSQQAYRAPRSTPRPVIHGPQTAVVVGKAENEIWTEVHGRVKVQFHWDRLGENDENSSCWIRVAQVWAGKKWGGQFIPRIGDEVVVEFLEGDPDRPLVTGCVYNQDRQTPFLLPDNATQSGLKTHSSKEGDDTTFNALRFEDKKGSEEIFFHAERDFTREVENDDILTVGIENDADGNPTIGVGGKAEGNQTITIFNNQTLTIGKKIGSTAPADGSQTVTIWKNQTVTIGDGKADSQDGSQKVSIFKNQDITVGAGKSDSQDGSQTLTIFKDQVVKIGDPSQSDGNQTVTINKSRTVTIKTGDDSLEVTQGNQTVSIKAGASSLEAEQSILLKVGQNSIKISPNGIMIKGTIVTIQGTAQVTALSPLCDVVAAGILTLKGGLIKLN